MLVSLLFSGASGSAATLLKLLLVHDYTHAQQRVHPVHLKAATVCLSSSGMLARARIT
jgi:hypothetical protein